VHWRKLWLSLRQHGCGSWQTHVAVFFDMDQ
jgi:hypothetical protein